MPDNQSPQRCRLVTVLGDQFVLESAALGDFDSNRDAALMAEVAEEATHVWSHKARISLFLSAMRRFRVTLHKRGWTVLHCGLDGPGNQGNSADEIARVVRQRRPKELLLVAPGESRSRQDIARTAADRALPSLCLARCYDAR